MTKWQDEVIMCMTILFGIAVIPSIITTMNGQPVNLLTSGLIMFGCYIIAFCFYTLDLKLSFTMETFNGSMWLLLFIVAIL